MVRGKKYPLILLLLLLFVGIVGSYIGHFFSNETYFSNQKTQAHFEFESQINGKKITKDSFNTQIFNKILDHNGYSITWDSFLDFTTNSSVKPQLVKIVFNDITKLSPSEITKLTNPISILDDEKKTQVVLGFQSEFNPITKTLLYTIYDSPQRIADYSNKQLEYDWTLQVHRLIFFSSLGQKNFDPLLYNTKLENFLENHSQESQQLFKFSQEQSSIIKFINTLSIVGIAHAQSCTGTYECGVSVGVYKCNDGSSCSGPSAICPKGGSCTYQGTCQSGSCADCGTSSCSGDVSNCTQVSCLGASCLVSKSCSWNSGSTCPSGQIYCGAQGTCSASCRSTGGLTCQQWLDANCSGSTPPGGGGGDGGCGASCTSSSDCQSGLTCADPDKICTASSCPPSTSKALRPAGRVLDCNNNPVSGVEVQFHKNTGGNITDRDTTDGNGYYELYNDDGTQTVGFAIRTNGNYVGTNNDSRVGSGPTKCVAKWESCDPGDYNGSPNWWNYSATSGFDFKPSNCPTPTPANRSPQCSISGSSTAIVGQSNNYTVGTYDPDGDFDYSQVFVGKTNMDPNNQQWTQVGGNISYSPLGTSRSWTCTATGTYYLVCNGRDTTGFIPSGRCSGNPWCDGTISSCSGWSNCGNNDRITVTCTAPAPYCPDGAVNQSSEQCDDGNTVNTDACVNCKNAYCGDGYVRSGTEQCDDGNTVSGDGCSSSCQTEVTIASPSPTTVSCGQSCSSNLQCGNGQTCYQNICQIDACVGQSCTCIAPTCGQPCKSDANCPTGNTCDASVCKIPECVGLSCTCTASIPSMTLSVTESCNAWGDPKPTLKWNAVSGAAEYRVFRCGTPGCIPTWIPPGGSVTGTSFVDTTAFGSNQEIHNYRVRAYNSSGVNISSYSNILSIGPYRCPVTCDPATNWNAWGACSLSCGGGTQYRTNNCAGVSPQSRSCNAQSCCDSTSWGSWSTCSQSCGGGTQYRTNACGDVESRSCNTQSCCVPNCSGLQCGQDNGCGQPCPSSDNVCNFSNSCGQTNVCGTVCSNSDNTCDFSPKCGQSNVCGTVCSSTDDGSPATVRNLSPSSGNYRVTNNEVNITWSAPSGGLADQYELKIYPTSLYSNPTSANCSNSLVNCVTRTSTNYTQSLVENMGISLTIAIRAINTSCGTDIGPWLERDIDLVQDISGNFYLDNGGATQSGNNICSGGGTSAASINTSSSITASTGGTDSISSNNYTVSGVPYSPASWSTVKNTVTLTLFNTYHSAQTQVCACPSNGDLYTCEYEQIHSPQNSVNFYVTSHDLSGDPWWQSRGGLVYSGNNLSSEIPDSCESDPTCAAYLITQAFTPSSISSFNSISAGIPMVGAGSISTNGNNHISERSPKAKVEGSSQNALSCDGYDTLSKKVDLSGVQTLAGTIQTKPSGTIVDADANIAVAVANGSLTIAPEIGDTWTVASGETLLIFVGDNLTIEDPEGLEKLFEVEEGGFLGFIVKNNIQFDDSVGYSESAFSENTANVAGVFIADNITVRGSNIDSVIDKKFIASGSLVACNQVAFQRDYDNLLLGREYNATIPTETVQFRPDFARNFPNILKKSNLVWQEVN